MFLSLWIDAFDQNVKAEKLYKANTKGGLENNTYSIEYFYIFKLKNKARLLNLYVTTTAFQ